MRRAGGVLLEGRDLALAATAVALGVKHLQRVNAAVPADLLRVRDELAAFAAAETAAVVVSGERETGKPAAAVIVAASGGAEMTAQEAAGVLAVSVQTVRSWCRSGELSARRDPAGGWRIGAGPAAALAARRERGTT